MFKDDYYIIIKNPTKKELKKEDGIRDNIYFALVYKQKIFKENLFIRALGQSEISKLLTNIYYKQYKIKRKRLSDDENKKIISDIKEILENKEKIIIDDKEMILDSSFKAKEFKKKSIRKKSLIGGGLGAAIGIGIITSAILNNNNEDKLEDTNIKTENTIDKKIEISNDIEILVADDEIKPNPVEITKNEYDVNIPVFETDNIINSKHYSYESNNDLFNKIYYSYGQYFENYGNKYGIDPYLLCAISCQENPTLIKRTDKNAGYDIDDEWISTLDPEVTTYLRYDGSKIEVCGVFGSGSAGTVCLTSSYYNSTYSETGDYASDYENISLIDNVETISELEATGLKGYSLAKAKEMLNKGASSCGVTDGSLCCDMTSGGSCCMDHYGYVSCTSGNNEAGWSVNIDGTSNET